MKLKTFAAALAAATIAGSAFAADLPSRKVEPAYIAPAPIMTWAGFYIGLNAGYGWTADNRASFGYTDTAGGGYGASAAAGNYPLSLSLPSKGGFLGGGQIGWNWQSGALVAGIETDIQGRTGGSGSAFFSSPGIGGFVPASTAVTTKQTWFGTLRGRIGFTVTPTFLLYATGGLAYGNVGLTHQTAFAVAPFAQASSASSTRLGWTAGAGGEWMFAPNWSAKLEYLYTDLGSISSPPLVYTYGANISTAAAKADFRSHTVRIGLNYHFNWGAAPVVAKY